MGVMAARGKFTNGMGLSIKKHPPSHKGTEGESSRYHLWFACTSRCGPHGVEKHLSLYRANPSFPTAYSGKPLREVFGRLLPLPCTNRQLSGGKVLAYFVPSQCYFLYFNKYRGFVKYFIPKSASQMAGKGRHFRIPLPHCRRFSRLSRLAHRRQGCTVTAPHSICCRRRSFLPAVPYQKSGKGYIPRNPNPPPGYSSCTLPPGSPYGKQNTPPFHRLIPHRRRKSPFFGISHIRKACNSSRIKKAIAHFRALEHFT